ncbi:ATP F0F1 synthase subunit I [Bacterioplanes sanyensis]|uniref:ATP F0F1 synthase subunit I n=1 Tax=Bacterioplanes sanyensis TaxID=1249553 RepID=A0A222FFX2_9GAMM|nr:ATP synthase subunit I [Bacterioplanes sanyensis]ASP37888.1 ATP F0F1 synthase subunit I [Bacterioplanes sanyensis]
MSSIPRPPAYKIVLIQLVVTLIVALLAWLHSDVAAGSALLGGLLCALPNAYFIWRVFRFTGARSTPRIVQSLYRGEAWKFLLTAMGFAVVFIHVEPLNYLALFAGYLTVQLGHVFSAGLKNF